MEKSKKTFKEVMILSWQFIKKNGLSHSEAMRIAWMNIKLRAKMLTGSVKFSYLKKDGTIRVAVGTLASNMLPEIKGTGSATVKSNQCYFDTEKQSFRSFIKINLLEIA